VSNAEAIEDQSPIRRPKSLTRVTREAGQRDEQYLGGASQPVAAEPLATPFVATKRGAPPACPSDCDSRCAYVTSKVFESSPRQAEATLAAQPGAPSRAGASVIHRAFHLNPQRQAREDRVDREPERTLTAAR
jgi:hypothetical protein